MPTTLIIIFLLLFAALAFGWFYLQRAKARSSTPEADAAPAAPQRTDPPEG